jgi:hypothetical protein
LRREATDTWADIDGATVAVSDRGRIAAQFVVTLDDGACRNRADGGKTYRLSGDRQRDAGQRPLERDCSAGGVGLSAQYGARDRDTRSVPPVQCIVLVRRRIPPPVLRGQDVIGVLSVRDLMGAIES